MRMPCRALRPAPCALRPAPCTLSLRPATAACDAKALSACAGSARRPCARLRERGAPPRGDGGHRRTGSRSRRRRRRWPPPDSQSQPTATARQGEVQRRRGEGGSGVGVGRRARAPHRGRQMALPAHRQPLRGRRQYAAGPSSWPRRRARTGAAERERETKAGV